MEKHHHTIAILTTLFAILVGIVGGWVFFTWRAQPVQVVMLEKEIVTPNNTREVFINGAKITQTPLAAGEYWYDPISGLYGHKGEIALGVMPTGFAVPTLRAEASDGMTEVFFNNRELRQEELSRYEQELGKPLAAGTYTLDASGIVWRGAESLGLVTLGRVSAMSPPASAQPLPTNNDRTF